MAEILPECLSVAGSIPASQPTLKLKDNFMKWFERFKAGQEVRVVKAITSWRFDNFNGDSLTGRGATWVSDMDKTIGKVFTIIFIDSDIGYRLETREYTHYKYNYWYPAESLEEINVKGRQLMFNFMSEE